MTNEERAHRIYEAGRRGWRRQVMIFMSYRYTIYHWSMPVLLSAEAAVLLFLAIWPMWCGAIAFIAAWFLFYNLNELVSYLAWRRYDRLLNKRRTIMNDTHGETGKGWYGFDLDGTLAKYDGWKGIDHIGEPVKPMVELMKRMHDEGKVVKIMTARAAPCPVPETAQTRYPLYAGDEIGDVPEYAARWMHKMKADGHVSDQVEACAFYSKKEWAARDFIADWCLEHLGFLPEIVYQKDHLMLELYDDRVKQVVPNEGWLVEDIAKSKRQVHVIHASEEIDVGWAGKILCFLFGVLAASLVYLALHTFAVATTTVPEAEQRLHDAVIDYMQTKIRERTEGLLK